MSRYFIGIDIGSTCAKAAVLDAAGNPVTYIHRPTGSSSLDTAEALAGLLRESGYDPEHCATVATGYGRVSVPYADKTLTEITCHARGAMALYDAQDLTVIDVGGQDTKIIRVQQGMVKDFLMNDKCSAGTGRFLEVMASTLDLDPGRLCTLAEQGSGVTISSMCTVFAESEVISLIGRGEARENIAFAVVDSIVKKVAAQFRKLEPASDQVCLSGGLCECGFFRQALSRELQQEIRACPQAHFAGALGAAKTAATLNLERQEVAL